jgi:hypothetical protein
MIRYAYADLLKRLTDARSWATGVTEGNRCAVVVGVALNIKPSDEAQSFRTMPANHVATVPGMPFLAKFFVKAQHLADATAERFGPPDIKVPGTAAIDAIASKQGVIFMQDCWGGFVLPVIKIKVTEDTADHIDLWDGSTLEIYRDKPIGAVHAFVKKSKQVWFWEATNAAA